MAGCFSFNYYQLKLKLNLRINNDPVCIWHSE